MKRTVYAFALFALAACSKPADVDPRENMVGTYMVNYQSTMKNQTTGQTLNNAGSTSVSVQKGSGATDLTVTNSDGQFKATVSGNGFEIAQQNVPVTFSGNTFSFVVAGSGSVNGKTLTLNYSMVGNVSGQTLQGVFSGSGSK